MEDSNRKARRAVNSEGVEMINPLRNEKIFVRFVPKKGGLGGNNPEHIMYGGLAKGVKINFCAPCLESTGSYKNVLTNSEKDFLEDALGLDANALSIYRKTDNFWDTFFVSVGKEGLSLDLSNPEDYIRYKILLANSDTVAPDLETLQDRPKATYRFVLIADGEETRIENASMDSTMASYREFGKIENDIDTMRVLVELLDSRPYSSNTKQAFLKSRINALIQADPKAFLRQITDPMLHTKVILRRSVELGKVAKKNDFYYVASTGAPMCSQGENSTLSVAARWLNQPANSDIKALLESEVDKARMTE